MHPSAKFVFRLVLLVWAAMVPVRAAQSAAEAAAPAASPAGKGTLEAQLIGTWVLAEATTPGNPSGIGVRYKTFTAGR